MPQATNANSASDWAVCKQDACTPSNVRMFPGLPGWVPQGRDNRARTAHINAYATRQLFTPEDIDDSGIANPDIPAGYTYLAQFVDHDLTYDLATPQLRIRNGAPVRAPRLNLDSIYGTGPLYQPYLYYGGAKRAAFLLGAGQNPMEVDLPRNALGQAVIADARNDVNLVLSQVHLALLRLHNQILRNLVHRGEAQPGNSHFSEARRIVTWFYQYVVWNDLLARLVDPLVHAEVLQQSPGIYTLGNAFYPATEAHQLPLEFSAAACRFTQSMIQGECQLNAAAEQCRAHLQGFRSLPANHSVQWDWFLPFPSSPMAGPQGSRSINPRMSRVLMDATCGDFESSGFKNIYRNWMWNVPAGLGHRTLPGYRTHRCRSRESGGLSVGVCAA